ncbi:MAG: hypothetical protein PWR08_437 [Thermoanaerobacterium sp.]|uniref:Septal ring factor EnvC (AmiA/AmiB activator) n=1 Tax=Thermoanaerobacterium butyriciformans TaxID=1702242 RepID=A0ABS4NEB4_9THEO|nr:hypothetical protein [Thermoanaerobacterium butyriciformans]MBP2072014.1 septal ring factor EnvC (AmiA/AmiB activator) [Thermoanaerobacterium butyriciformans]MDK2806524.1 hypothetical protein [Thermoanaerobacterium sp.]MDN5316313.1 hypothetical protein [Thermoanaerobacterium sp.]
MENDNLESAINQIAFEFVNERILDTNEINKLLGVLSNDGVYAMWVYALDKIGCNFSSDKNKLEGVRVFKLLKKIAELDKYVTNSLNYENLIKEISDLGQEIDKINSNIKNSEERKIEHLKKEKNKKEEERREKLNEYFINLANKLETLLFFKDILEKTLIYARYHAKAMEE